MAQGKAKAGKVKEYTVEEKLKALYSLQKVDSQTDKIKILRGELPLEVQDLEDEIVGLETRVDNYKSEVKNMEDSVSTKKNEIIQAEKLIKKYEDQQMKVRNNREFDSISKEIEYQNLEMELCEKRIKEFTQKIKEKGEIVDTSVSAFNERKDDLKEKKSELDGIIADTKKEEENLIKKSDSLHDQIDPRLLAAYQRIRSNARNGLALVCIERGACGGCFNKIPPQRQLDIKSRKKVIVCEYCGRILVDEDIDSKPEETKDTKGENGGKTN